MVFKTPVFCQKNSKFGVFGPYVFVQISPAWGTNILKDCMSALAMGVGRSFDGKSTVKIEFLIGYLISLLLILTLEV